MCVCVCQEWIYIFLSSECIEKFGAELGLEVWEATNKAFDTMPIAAVIDKKVCVSTYHCYLSLSLPLSPPSLPLRSVSLHTIVISPPLPLLQVFCVHGGIPLPTLGDGLISSIADIPVTLCDPMEESALAWDIMWNDPIR